MCISLVIMFIFHSSFRILLNSYMPASSGRRLVHSSIGRGGLCGAGATRGHRPEGRGQESGASLCECIGMEMRVVARVCVSQRRSAARVPPVHPECRKTPAANAAKRETQFEGSKRDPEK